MLTGRLARESPIFQTYKLLNHQISRSPNLSKRKPIKHPPFAFVLNLKIRLDVITDSAVGFVDEIDLLQVGAWQNDFLHVLEITRVVGLDRQARVGFHDAQGSVHKFRLNQAAFVVAFFGPRVGMVDVQCVDTRVGDLMDHEVTTVAAHHAHVGKAPARHTVGGILVVFVGPFDADEVQLRMFLGPPYKKGALMAADFQLQRCFALEQRAQIDRLGQLKRIDGDVGGGWHRQGYDSE